MNKRLAIQKSLLVSGLLMVSGILTSQCSHNPQVIDGSAGYEVPSRRFLDIAQYQYFCQDLIAGDIHRLEEVLSLYGEQGWDFAGFVNQQGATTGFCMKR